MSSPQDSAQRRVTDRPGQILQVQDWDAAELTHFFFPEGEEVNAAAAAAYYAYYNIFTLLHPVTHFGDYVTSLRINEPRANLILWGSYQSDELVRRACLRGGLSEERGTAPPRSVWSVLSSTPRVIYGIFAGTAGAEGDDAPYLPTRVRSIRVLGTLL